MDAPPSSKKPQSVLFACSFNSVRSPMAEGIAKHYFGREVFIGSAGLRKGELDPFAVAALEEIGIDITKHRPRTFDDLEDDNFDMIISLSPEAYHRALEFIRSAAIEAVYWPTIDPTAVQGSREQMLHAYRGVRDELVKRIRQLLDWRQTPQA